MDSRTVAPWQSVGTDTFRAAMVKFAAGVVVVTTTAADAASVGFTTTRSARCH